MSDQYKKMEERLTKNITELKGIVEGQEDEVKDLNEEIHQLTVKRDERNAEMDE